MISYENKTPLNNQLTMYFCTFHTTICFIVLLNRHTAKIIEANKFIFFLPQNYFVGFVCAVHKDLWMYP